MIINVLLFFGYTIGSVTGLIILKRHLKPAIAAIGSGVGFFEWSFVAAGSALYLGAFGLWLLILSRMELSVAYPIAVSLTLAFTAIGGSILLGEEMSALRILGLVFVFGGVLALVKS